VGADEQRDDHQLAHDLARRTMAMLVARRDELAGRGVSPADWGPIGDREADDFILGELRAARPDDAILSEESADDLCRLDERRVWVIDPLDGTREYTSPGRTDWAVHVALTIEGAPDAAAVALPGGAVWSTAGPSPDRAPERGPHSGLRMVVSRTRPPQLAYDVAAAMGVEVVPLGSAGAKAAAVLSGEADLYLHAGGMRQWDSCAPVGVALAHGFHASRVDGSPLRYNGADINLPDLLICRPDLAAEALAAIRRVAS
jgi:3'(2'), 5'-bisphosphate nucleotidase